MAEAPTIGSIDLSDEAQTLVWTEGLPGGTSQVVVLKDGEEVRLTDDPDGHNSSPTLSDDGKTVVWLWRNPRYLHPNEVRQAELA